MRRALLSTMLLAVTAGVVLIGLRQGGMPLDPLAIRAAGTADMARSESLAAGLARGLAWSRPWRGDSGLHTAAWTLLRYTEGLETVRVDGVLDQALEGAGVYDPLVLPVEVRAEDEESAVTRLVATLSNELSEVAFNRVGLAVGQRRSGVRVVALLARRQVELDPRPGWLPPGATWQLRGRLIGEARSARVLVLRPGGRIEEIPTHVAGGRLAADVPVLKRGPHRIEVAVEEASGRPGLPAALVSVWCGRGPILAGGPSAKAAGVPRFSVLPADPVPTKKGGAVSRMRTWADDLRNEQGLPALSRDSKLDDVARRHAEYLARSRSLGHVDAKGRDPMRRLKRRGVVAKAAGENVAAGLSVEGIQSSLAKSPSHLREILRSDVRRTGLGLAERDGVLFFVQVFAGP